MSLPKGWASPTIGEVFQINPKHPTETDRHQLVSFVAMPSVDEYTGEITSAVDRVLSDVWTGYTHFADSDVIFAKITPCMENGKVAIARGMTNSLACGSTEFYVLRADGAAIPEYLWRFLRQKSFRDDAENHMSGAVGQQRVPRQYLEEHSFPLPPLAEQRRIVAKLDLLTLCIARARAELARVAMLAKVLRERGLECAFSGGLTKDGDVNQGWSTVRFEEVAEIASNLVSPATVLDLPHIAPNHIESGHPKLLPYKTVRQDGVISSKHRFYPGQLLYSKIRPYLRKVVQVDFDGACSADMYPIRPKCHPKYLMYWMLSPQFTWLTTQQEGRTVLPKINQSALNAIPTPVPSENIQESIALRLDAIFSRAERLEAEAARARTLLDRMEAAILTKAFRGELVPKDPNDEPASVLLDRIRAQRTAQAKRKPRADRSVTA